MYLRARYYAPTIGRFISEDKVWSSKIKFANGQEIDDPLSLNLYTYCSNNPVMLIDPSGFSSKSPTSTNIFSGEYWNQYFESIGYNLTHYELQDFFNDINYLGEALPPAGSVAKGSVSIASKTPGLLEKGREFFANLLKAGSTSEPKLLAVPKMNLHHIFPQNMKAQFAKLGIDVDKYTVELTQGIHLSGVHGKGGFVVVGDITLQGKFNDAWKTFFKSNPNATSKEVYQYAGQLMDKYGLSGLKIVPYK